MKKQNVLVSGTTFSLSIESSDTLTIDGESYRFDFLAEPNGINTLTLMGRIVPVFCKRISENTIDVWINNNILSVQLEDPRAHLLRQLKSLVKTDNQPILIKAPMPGMVVTVEVKLNDMVDSGAGLLILEAMKMENEIRSTVRGRISRVEVANRTPVEKDQLLLTIDPIGSP
jgi:biotin carboxyl carrier protein